MGMIVLQSTSKVNLLIVILVLLIGEAMPARFQEGWLQTNVGPEGKDLNAIFFLDSKRGWVGGDNGFLSRTDDGGSSWVQQTVGTKDAINDIYFRDKEDGCLIAGHSIYITRDSGARWTEARSFLPREFDGASVELYSVRFPSKKRGWVVGSISRQDRVVDSILVNTDNGGETWVRQRVPSRVELIHIDFQNEKRGWIAGAGGTILKTLDGGLTWLTQNSGSSGTIYHVDFRDEKKGWAVGERGLILRTTDGGERWEAVTAPVRSTLLSVQFVNDDDGWTVGRGGTILRTSDGGRSWVQQESTTKQNLYALYIGKKLGWAVGASGIILRYER